jgi:competence protein ComGC
MSPLIYLLIGIVILSILWALLNVPLLTKQKETTYNEIDFSKRMFYDNQVFKLFVNHESRIVIVNMGGYVENTTPYLDLIEHTYQTEKSLEVYGFKFFCNIKKIKDMWYGENCGDVEISGNTPMEIYLKIRFGKNATENS